MTGQPTPPAEDVPELTADGQRQLVGALRASLSRGGKPVALHETHISYVLVAPPRAWKFKKALCNAFLDNTTLARRHHHGLEELRLNRRLAPALYLGLLPVVGTSQQPELGGAGPVLDWVVEMQAFDQDGLWDRMADTGRLQAAHIDALVAQLGPFHNAAAVASPTGRLGSPAQVRAPMLDNLRDLHPLWPAQLPTEAWARLRDWEQATYVRLAPLMAARLAQGRVRECHGDLHLGNVAQIDGVTTVFDGIEFNDGFRWLDVMSDVAFMAMDLQARGLPALAHRFVDGWLQRSGDYTGLPLLDYDLVYRALVRAKVRLMRAAQGGVGADLAGSAALCYLQQALRFTEARRPALLITHGLSGSGKTTLTQGLLEICGAVRIRSDVERKRLVGLALDQPSGSGLGLGLYTAERQRATYDRLFDLAAPVLASGRNAILDATFLQRAERDRARDMARATGVRFRLLAFDAAPATLAERIRRRAQRGDDVSEADEAVLAAQIASCEPLQADEMAETFRVSPCAGIHDDGPPQVDWTALLDGLTARA